MSFKTFTSGAVLTAAELNTYLMQQANIVCTSGTRPSSPVEGMRIIETDTDLEYTYSGSGWVVSNTLGAWVSWTPTVGGWSLGNGTLVAAYAKTGRTVHLRITLTAGSTTTFGAQLTFSALFAAAAVVRSMGGYYLDASAGVVGPLLHEISDSTITPCFLTDAQSRDNAGLLDTTKPIDWTTSDEVQVVMTYEATA